MQVAIELVVVNSETESWSVVWTDDWGPRKKGPYLYMHGKWGGRDMFLEKYFLGLVIGRIGPPNKKASTYICTETGFLATYFWKNIFWGKGMSQTV
jgi:hypothetical protein